MSSQGYARVSSITRLNVLSIEHFSIKFFVAVSSKGLSRSSIYKKLKLSRPDCLIGRLLKRSRNSHRVAVLHAVLFKASLVTSSSLIFSNISVL